MAGLEQTSDRIDAAAARLGRRIAASIKRSLGIRSPSTVMRRMMGDVGSGVVLGLADQESRVEVASGSLARRIMVSPEVATYASRQRAAGVSGNEEPDRGGFRDLIVHTPTEDPAAVAHEVLNEVTGRL